MIIILPVAAAISSPCYWDIPVVEFKLLGVALNTLLYVASPAHSTFSSQHNCSLE